VSTAQLPAWTAEERESFFAAIARHRRAAWQVSAVATVCIAILAFVVATLTAPLFYALIGLTLDVINPIIPMPDLLGAVTDTLGEISDHMEILPATRWLYLALIAALPGMVAMLFVLFALRRIVREAEIAGAQELASRAPDPTVLPEQRLLNVVSEMAIAANIKMPKVVIIESDAVNAGVYGPDDQSATVIVSSALLRALNRAQIQAVCGHLIGLIANGDVVQGMRVAQSLSLFGLVARLSDGIVDPQAWSRLWQTMRAAWKSGASSADVRLILELTNPFGGEPRNRSSAGRKSNELTWREWLRMPLYGPVVISGFFGGLVSSVVLEPMLAFVWRRRKYLADAIAVQLTRDPQALCDALGRLGSGERANNFPVWSAHMLVVDSSDHGGLFSGSGVAMYPALDKRLSALGRMGAAIALMAPRQFPLWLQLLFAAGSLVCALLLSAAIYLLVVISLALSSIFTLLPTMILHAVLR
jgi:Zn-dependent protease with chaperone function